MGRRKPIFVDRDGVLNVDVAPYVSRLEQLMVFPWTMGALKKLYENGFDIYVISNQQGVGLGITSEEELNSMTEALKAEAAKCGFVFSKFYFCTALDTADDPWRKPAPGMILAAAEEFGLTLVDSFFIGDKWSDIECGARAGCRPLLVLSGVTGAGGWEHWKYLPEKVFRNLGEAADWILRVDD